jgi:hypothetical protein
MLSYQVQESAGKNDNFQQGPTEMEGGVPTRIPRRGKKYVTAVSRMRKLPLRKAIRSWVEEWTATQEVARVKNELV